MSIDYTPILSKLIATPEIVSDAEAVNALTDLVEIALQASEDAGGIKRVCVRGHGEIVVETTNGPRMRVIVERDV